jgi:hypothetical protein
MHHDEQHSRRIDEKWTCEFPTQGMEHGREGKDEEKCRATGSHRSGEQEHQSGDGFDRPKHDGVGIVMKAQCESDGSNAEHEEHDAKHPPKKKKGAHELDSVHRLASFPRGMNDSRRATYQDGNPNSRAGLRMRST